MEEKTKQLEEQVDVLSRTMGNVVRNTDAMLKVMAHHNFIKVSEPTTETKEDIQMEDDGKEAPEEVKEDEGK